uniref:Probable salivary secreted peptide n=1 Tax=Cacopsylla melanoneura TaxID=428564 RepID=A0A8D8TJ69_9HEMI
MYLATMLPVCICFLSLLITSTPAASELPKHLRRNSGEEILTSNENSDLVRSKNDDVRNYEKNLASYVHMDDEDLFESKDQDLVVGEWWWDDQEGSHNLTQGQKTDYDILLLSQYVYKPYRFLRIVEATLVHHPQAQYYYINYIEASDQHSDPSDAGYARIIAGGVGHRNVTLHFESKRNHGLKFLVEIWGHRAA